MTDLNKIKVIDFESLLVFWGLRGIVKMRPSLITDHSDFPSLNIFRFQMRLAPRRGKSIIIIYEYREGDNEYCIKSVNVFHQGVQRLFFKEAINYLSTL